MDLGITVSDPVTALAIAGFNCVSAYFQFLCTPEGQKVAADVRQLTWDRLVDALPKKEK